MSEVLPRGWAYVRVGDVLHLVNGFAFKPVQWQTAGLPIIRIQNLNSPDAPFNYCDSAMPEKIRVRSGDLLFAWSGTPGTSFGAHIWTRGEAWLNQHIFRVEFDPRLFDAVFLRHAINQNLDHYIAEAHGGAGLAHVTKGKFEASLLRMAPPAEQGRIVEKLKQALEKIDASKQRLAKVPVLLKRFRQSVLAAACSGRLTADWREAHPSTKPASESLNEHATKTNQRERNTRRMKPATGLTLLDYSEEFPSTWTWLKVRELVQRGAIYDVQDGNHGELYPRAEDFGDIGVKYITAEHVIRNRVQLESAPSLKFEKARRLRVGFAKANDVILTHNATVGRVALLPLDSPNVILSTSTTYYRVDEKVLSPRYLATFLRSHFFQRQLQAVMEQTTRNQVSVTKQVEFGVAVPPLPEQQEIVLRVDALFKLADSIEARFEKAQAQIDKLTPALVAKAFRGELVPQDPNDEPASVLLARIRAERAAARDEESTRVRRIRKRPTT